jgi:PKD repeat protein
VLLGSKLGIQTGEVRVAGAGALKASFTALATANTPGNTPPTADFNPECENLTCHFQDGSSDSDGNLIGWGWDFGDGSTSAEREPAHSYSAPGTYTVTLRVIDNGGSTAEASTQVTVSSPAAPPSNNPPQADFELTCDHLSCSFIDQSDDPDGSIAGRHWDFGDGSTSSQRNPSHAYLTAGRYQVALTVTDNEGAENTKTRTAAPQAPAEPPPPPPSNKPPVADFGVQCNDLACSFTDRSKDDDGSVVQWQWSFGDGATSNDRNPSHSYQTAGPYEVLLTITDNGGATDNKSRTAQPTAPAPPPPPSNKPPTADFAVQCSNLTCSFTDRSKDDDGSVVQWQWNFGDGSTSSDRNPSHSYQTAGQYQVLLTVTDDDGAAGSKTRTADAQAPAPPPPPPPNKPPDADFEVHCDHLTCTFTDKSKDDDGSIVSWQWNFGDGATSSEQNPVHAYDAKGKFAVVLTVTDNGGASATKTKSADVK